MGEPNPSVTWYVETLTPRQRSVLRRLGPVMTAEGFYLGGGTAIALWLGHRRSADFDWFSDQTLADPLSLASRIQRQGVALQTHQIARGTLDGQISGVRCSFFEYSYPLLDALVTWPEYGCSVASLDDLAAMKLAAVAQRGSRKDFLDVYALGTNYKPLAGLLDAYRQKYAVDDIGHVLYGLAYLEVADAERMPRMVWQVSWRTVKATIRRWLREAMP